MVVYQLQQTTRAWYLLRDGIASARHADLHAALAFALLLMQRARRAGEETRFAGISKLPRPVPRRMVRRRA